MRDADRIIGLCEAFEKGHPRLILNRLKPRMVSRGEMMSVEDVLQILAIDLLGVVPDDEAIVTATNRGEVAVLDRGSLAGRAFIDIARRIGGEQVPFMALEEQTGRDRPVLRHVWPPPAWERTLRVQSSELMSSKLTSQLGNCANFEL